jgi:hypothetical protein
VVGAHHRRMPVSFLTPIGTLLFFPLFSTLSRVHCLSVGIKLSLGS